MNASMRALKALLRRTPKKKESVIPIEANRWKIVRGDKVEVLDGPERGKQGTVLKVIRAQNRVVVEGVNVRRRTRRPTPQGEPGRMITYPGAIDASNVNLVCPSTNLPTRINFRYLEDGTRVRLSKRSGAIIPKPEWKREVPRRAAVGPKDTKPEDVYEVTYEGYVPKMYKKKE